MKSIKIQSILLLFFLVFSLSFAALQNDDIEVRIFLDQQIPMRDGIRLAAKIWMPEEITEPLPAIFSLTPYVSDEGQTRGMYFARNGYVYLQVDCRGRGNSEGEFIPNENDGKDGFDAAKWIAKQDWCDGQVAMRGGSYRGMDQWQTLKEAPPSLKTIVPTAAAYPGIDIPHPNNIFMTYFPQWHALVAGKTVNWNLFYDTAYWHKKYYSLYKEYSPLSRLAKKLGTSEKFFNRLLQHPTYDDYWRALTPSEEDYRKISIPILTITGYFDTDQQGAMTYYREHMAYGTEEGREKHYLVAGPWDHAGTRTPVKELKGLTFGENSVLDMDRLHLEWYDWVLKGRKKPKFLKKRVCYYMMSENEWKFSDRIEEISNGNDIWYLFSKDGSPHDIYHSGSLTKILTDEAKKPDIFYYDPLELISKEDYLWEKRTQIYMHQREFFPDEKLVYHSPALEKDLEVAGYIRIRLYIEMDVPDTDLAVSVFEIRPDGKKIFIGQDMIRARYRNSISKAELVKTGEIDVYEFNNFYFTACRLKKGSRLRLILHCLNSPDWAKNFNSGGAIADETKEDARTATIKLYHDRKHPSLLELPTKK
ncbi:MAG: CocE/NonD family hydrolase [Candidatus Aminicenantes bacterium]|nr:CocE/NonD family hydrolase [Candidatus Aminicenantes bacterium]